MIAALLLVASPVAIEIAAVAPEEFRRKVEFNHVCVTDVILETGYREFGALSLERGENLPEITLASIGPSHMFQNGIVDRVDAQRFEDGVVFFVQISGERNGQPAKLVIRDEHRRYRIVTASLEQGALKREYQCDPDIRRPKS